MEWLLYILQDLEVPSYIMELSYILQYYEKSFFSSVLMDSRLKIRQKKKSGCVVVRVQLIVH